MFALDIRFLRCKTTFGNKFIYVLLYTYKAWSLVLRQERTLKVSEFKFTIIFVRKADELTGGYATLESIFRILLKS